MTGHKAPIYSLAFSMCGRFLASGSADNRILIWDLAHGHLIAAFCGHAGTVHSLCFSRDGTVLATGNTFIVFIWGNEFNFLSSKVHSTVRYDCGILLSFAKISMEKMLMFLIIPMFVMVNRICYGAFRLNHRHSLRCISRVVIYCYL